MNPLYLVPFLAVAVLAAPQVPEIPQPPADLPGGVMPPSTNSTQPPSDLPGGISPPDTGNSTQPPADVPVAPPADLPGVPGMNGTGADVPIAPPSDLPGGVNASNPGQPPMVPGQGGGGENGTGSDQGGLPIPGSPIVAGGGAQVVQLVNPIPLSLNAQPQAYIQARSLPVQQPYVSRERIYVPVRPQYAHVPILQHYAIVA